MSEDATKIEKLTTLRVKTNQKTNDTQNETEDYKAVATTQTNNPQPEISKTLREPGQYQHSQSGGMCTKRRTPHDDKHATRGNHHMIIER